MTRVRAACRAEFESDMEKELEEIGGFPVMTAEMHALQLKRLEGLGEEPSQEELGAMRWPQRSWWADRARIGARKALQLTLASPNPDSRGERAVSRASSLPLTPPPHSPLPPWQFC